jgi:hypothetical protein
VTTRQKLSRLRADFELLSDEIRHLTIAEGFNFPHHALILIVS